MELAWIQEQLPEGVRIERDLSQLSDLIGLAVDNVAAAFRGGAVLMAIILFRFLWDFRTTGISILAIPLSLAVALLSLRLFGGTINTMTLGAMAIAIGALVDDAIIDVEKVFRRFRKARNRLAEEGGSVLLVVFDATREVSGPIVSATLIIAVKIFGPDLYREFGGKKEGRDRSVAQGILDLEHELGPIHHPAPPPVPAPR